MRAQDLIYWLVGIACLPGVGKAAGFEIAEVGALSGGTAGAGTARDGDPAAAWYNPAILADGRGLRLGLGVTLALPDIRVSATDPSWSGENRQTLSAPPYLYLSYARGRLAGGLSFNVPFGSNLRWPTDWAGRFEVMASRPQSFRLAPFLACRLGPLRVGAGPQLDMGSLELERNLDFIDTEGKVRLLLSGVGFGGHASLFWDAARFLQLGLSYRSRTRISLAGGAHFVSPLPLASRTPDQAARSEMTLPDKLTLGLAAKAGPVRGLLDLGWTFWEVHRKTRIDFADEETPDTVLTHSWKGSLAVRAGAEWEIRPTWTARGGVSFEQTPVPASTLSPASPDAYRLGFSLGAGLPLGRTGALDLFYQYLLLLPRTSQNPESPRAHYQGGAHFLGLGFRFLWLTRRG